MLAMAVGSCYLSYLPRFKKHVANIVRVFMTITLTVSDLNLWVLFSGADHSLEANRPLKSHILALIMGLNRTSLSLKLLRRWLSLTSTDLLLTYPSRTSFTAPGKSIDFPEEKLVLQAMKVTQGQCQGVETEVLHGWRGVQGVGPSYPILSNTKLHMMWTHEAGGVYNRFLWELISLQSVQRLSKLSLRC